MSLKIKLFGKMCDSESRLGDVQVKPGASCCACASWTTEAAEQVVVDYILSIN